MKRIIPVLALALSGLILTGCPDPNVPNPSATPSATQSSNPSPGSTLSPTSNPTGEPTISPTSQPTTTPTTAPTAIPSSPSTISSTPYPASNLAPITDGYRLTIDGKVFPTSLNSILNERYESINNQPGYLRLASLGYETVSDADNEYSFMFQLTTANAFSLGSNFNETDYSKVNLQIRRKNKKTGTTYNYYGETIPGGNKQIPANGIGNTPEIAGKLSSVTFSSDGQDKRYKGFVDTLVAIEASQNGVREFPPIRVKLEFNVILKDKIYSNPN